MMQEDEGKGLENINRSVKINTYEMARGIKDFKQLEEFIDLYIPALTAADIAVLATQHAKDKWNTIQILGDLEKHPSIFVLLDRIEKTKGGAIKVFNDYKNNKINPLTEFIKDTSYKIPSTIGTFRYQPLKELFDYIDQNSNLKIIDISSETIGNHICFRVVDKEVDNE